MRKPDPRWMIYDTLALSLSFLGNKRCVGSIRTIEYSVWTKVIISMITPARLCRVSSLSSAFTANMINELPKWNGQGISHWIQIQTSYFAFILLSSCLESNISDRDVSVWRLISQEAIEENNHFLSLSFPLISCSYPPTVKWELTKLRYQVTNVCLSSIYFIFTPLIIRMHSINQLCTVYWFLQQVLKISLVYWS